MVPPCSATPPQEESPAREYLEQVKCCHDTDRNESMVKKGFTATESGTWEENKETFKEKMRGSEWAFDGIKEAFDLVAKDEAEKMSIVQEIMLKSTDYLRRIIAPVGGEGGVTMSYLCPNCNRGTGTFIVRKPKGPEGGSDVTIRESPDELTLRAEDVNTLKAYIDVNHIKPERWGPPLVDADWYAFCQALYKGIEGVYDSF